MPTPEEQAAADAAAKPGSDAAATPAATPPANQAPPAPPPQKPATPAATPPAPSVPLNVLNAPIDGAAAAEEGEALVLMVSPRAFNLRLDNHQVVAIKKGLNEIPESVKDHPYLAAHGVVAYGGAPAPGAKANPDEAKVLREALEGQIGKTRAAEDKVRELSAKLAAAESRIRILEAGKPPAPPPPGAKPAAAAPAAKGK